MKISPGDDFDKLEKEYIIWREKYYKDSKINVYFKYFLKKLVNGDLYDDREKKEVIALASVMADLQRTLGEAGGLLFLIDNGRVEEKMREQAYARAAEWLSLVGLPKEIVLLKKLIHEFDERKKKKNSPW